jgi:hypothetical protein
MFMQQFRNILNELIALGLEQMQAGGRLKKVENEIVDDKN